MNSSAGAPPGLRGAWGQLWIIAGEEYRRSLETRWLFGFATLFAGVVLALSYFGLVASREVGFQSLARVTLSLLNLVLILVPLTSLMLGTQSLTRSPESLALLLAQPVRRRDVLVGKYLGTLAAMSIAQLHGFGGGGLLVAMSSGSEQVWGYVALVGLSLGLAAASLALAFLVAARWPDRVRALSVALMVWIGQVVLYDLLVLGLSAVLRGLALQQILVPALLLNPVDLVRVLTTLAVGSGALFGPTSASLVRTFGGPIGVSVSLAALACWIAGPVMLAVRVFDRRDL